MILNPESLSFRDFCFVSILLFLTSIGVITIYCINHKLILVVANIEKFEKQIECVYKGERYSVRDNGAALRHSNNDKRTRPSDNKWTFGKPNTNKGYMEIASVPVHRIIAVAFYGEPPSKEYVIDHIDTNRQNNRPENLRWVTRLENVLLNPITIKKIKIVCGCTVEEFLDDPSKFRHKFKEPNYEWMCTVSKEEAKLTLARMKSWAESDKIQTGGSLDKWVFNRSLPIEDTEQIPDLIFSITKNARQKNWKTPSEFTCCPVGSTSNSINAYITNLEIGKIFFKNQYSSSVIIDFATSEENNTLWIMCKNENNSIKPYSLVQVICENDLFIHTNLGSFFAREGIKKQFTLIQGLEWTGGETLDDFA